MPQKVNYQIQLDKVLEMLRVENHRPRLLLHACCAPCSSYVLDYLSQYFEITLFFYNPNISPKSEYDFRLAELERLCGEMPIKPVDFLQAEYNPQSFYDIAKGLENAAEGGERCNNCFRLRLGEAAKMAKRKGFDYFTTTLSISPMKNSQTLNQIGEALEKEYGVKYLYSDFKKKEGYKKSIQLSEKYGLYRQDYCGCIYSKRERQAGE